MASLVLRTLRSDDERQARALSAAFDADGHGFGFGITDADGWGALLTDLEDWSLGRNLPDGWVPWTLFVGEVAGQLVGRLSFRHELSDFLLHYGGHIGYSVHPEHRGRGHATAMLAQALHSGPAQGLDRILVTCDETNDASARVIEKCGGILEDVRFLEGVGKRRYWIAGPDAG